MKKIFFICCISLVMLNCYAENHQPILILSIPKSGTHLLGRLVELLTGQTHKTPGHPSLTRPLINKIMQLSHANQFSHQHIGYSNAKANTLRLRNIFTLFIYRDPRDQIISWINHTWQQPNKGAIDDAIFDFDEMQSDACMVDLNKGHHANSPIIAARIMAIIDSRQEYIFGLKGIRGLYEAMMPWAHSPYVCAIRFEDLIGEPGGGSRERQIQTIQRVAQYLGIDISLEECEEVSNKIFGNTATFREGRIGSWRNFFSPEHKMFFKQHTDNLVVDLGYEADLDW
jgi:sulfotransferase 6B1